ncbi:hypothetical protein [Serratia ficaria]|uniref:hypothetical protein n=1 Tax=Serratia ficaria TaxID=61651 RepID=UPI002182CD6C|nr:hypothetical protein [Serratia ficaria]CAI2537308.1 Uncharacterised protein [Serratia ficaria]
MEVIYKLILTLVVFILMYFVVLRLYNYVSNKRAIKQCEQMITLINIQLDDEALDKKSRDDIQTTKMACQHEINVRKGKVLLKSGWRPN